METWEDGVRLVFINLQENDAGQHEKLQKELCHL